MLSLIAKKVIPILFLITCTFLELSRADDECQKWFLKSGVKPGTGSCEVECTTSIVDMNTFSCPSKCEKLCSSTVPHELIKPLSYMKGLTEGDKAAIAKYPKEAISVYRAKEKADDLTEKVFKKAAKNDESDAFRHFVWSVLIVNELGEKKARYFLTAHEQDPGQPASEKKMDIANNEQGIKFAVEELKNKKPVELDKVEREALRRLKKGQLKVIKSNNRKIPSGYYSK